MKKEIKIDYISTGENIKEKMTKKNISIRALSEMLGVSFQAVHSYTTGVKLPSLSNFYLISKILETTIEDLLVVVEK